MDLFLSFKPAQRVWNLALKIFNIFLRKTIKSKLIQRTNPKNSSSIYFVNYDGTFHNLWVALSSYVCTSIKGSVYTNYSIKLSIDCTDLYVTSIGSALAFYISINLVRSSSLSGRVNSCLLTILFSYSFYIFILFIIK